MFELMHNKNGKAARVDTELHTSAIVIDSQGVSIKEAGDERQEHTNLVH